LHKMIDKFIFILYYICVKKGDNYEL